MVPTNKSYVWRLRFLSITIFFLYSSKSIEWELALILCNLFPELQLGTKKSHVEVHKIAYTLPQKTKTKRVTRSNNSPVFELWYPFPLLSCSMSCFFLVSNELHDSNESLLSTNGLEFPGFGDELREDQAEEIEERAKVILVPSLFLENFLNGEFPFTWFKSFSTFVNGSVLACFIFLWNAFFFIILACQITKHAIPKIQKQSTNLSHVYNISTNSVRIYIRKKKTHKRCLEEYSLNCKQELPLNFLFPVTGFVFLLWWREGGCCWCW